MGRIGHSLIMLGQLLHCSLFSVCWADDGLRVPVRVLARACVCIHKHEFLRWDKAMAGKRDPTLSRPPTPPRLKSMPLQIGFYITEAVRYEQLIFLPLFLLFFSFVPSLSLSFLLLSFILPFRVSLGSLFLHFFEPFTCRCSERALLSIQCDCVIWAVVISLSDWIFPYVSWNTLLW